MKAIEKIDFIIAMIPEGWKVYLIDQEEDGWFCELARNDKAHGHVHSDRWPLLSEAINQCLEQINQT